MKILWEDEELEAFSLKEGDIAVPIGIRLPADGGEAEITAYRAFAAAAEEFARDFAGDPFSENAMRMLAQRLTPPMTALGFEISPDNRDKIVETEITDAAQLRENVILPETELISDPDLLEKLGSAVTQKPEISGEEGEACAVITENGTIVAYAAENDMFGDEEAMEIHVECAPAYRKRGYASSCAALLTKHLLAEGYAVQYKYRSANRASGRVAEKVGFRCTGTQFSFVCYRKTESEE